MKISKLLILASTTFCLIIAGQVFAASEDKWGGYVEFFAKPGTERSLAKGDMFIPVYQNEEFLLYANIRAVFDDQSSREGNFGFGARRLFDDWIFGGYGYFDIKESENDNSFKQATLGVELLSDDWDFRLNGYIPEGDEEDANDLNRIEITGTQIGARLGEERALPGADMEVGRKLPFFQDTRFFLGGFYYDASGYEEVSGPKARLEMRFHDLPFFNAFSKGSRLTVGAEFKDDSVRGSQAFGLIQLRIPFGSHSTIKTPALSALEKRMVESVVRDEDVIISQRTSDDLLPVVNPTTGLVINNVSTIDANTANVPGAVTAAGQNSLVVADGSQGVINTGTINTMQGQILAGGGQVINLQAGGESIPFTPLGQRPTLNRAGNGDLVFINNDDNVTLNGLDLQGGRPLRVRSSEGVVVSNVTVNSTAGNRQAVLVQTNSTVIFENLSVNSAGREGVLLQSGSSAMFTNLAISNTGREGLELNNSTAQIQNATISDTNFEGIRAFNGSNLIADSLSITRSNRDAIEVNNAMLTLTNSTIQDINVSGGDDGITAVNNAVLNIDNVKIDNVSSQGVFINSGSVATINNLTVSNTNNEGIWANGNATLSLQNSMIFNSGTEGLQITNSMAQIENISINNSGTQGLRVSGNSNATISDLSINTAGAQGAIFQNASTTMLNNATISNTGNNGIQNQNTATLTANNVLISNTANDGIRSLGGTLTLNNSVIQDVGNGGANDDVVDLRNTTLSGSNNSIQGVINNGVACRNRGLNSGSVGFSVGPTASCP